MKLSPKLNSYEEWEQWERSLKPIKFRQWFDFVIAYKPNELFPKRIPERWYSPMDRSLRRELKSAFQNSYWFDTTSYKEIVELRIKYKDGFLQIFFPKHKIAPSSVRIFA